MLLLSEMAFVKPVPILEISNNEVKCNHGTTISNINKDKLYYLISRGLFKKEAISLILISFIKPVLNLFDDKKVDEIEKKLIKEISD